MADQGGPELHPGEHVRSDQVPGTVVFRHGADMDPTAARAADPRARFIARARLTDGHAETWGILLALPDPEDATREKDTAPGLVDVTSDDGRHFRARVATDRRDLEDAAAVLAAARYWELPPAYVRRLADTADGDAPGIG